MNFTGPIESSTLLPKIHRNSMLPPRCSRLPCMNIDVKAVSHVAGCGSAVPVTPGWPSHAIPPPCTSSQWSPGCVNS